MDVDDFEEPDGHGDHDFAPWNVTPSPRSTRSHSTHSIPAQSPAPFDDDLDFSYQPFDDEPVDHLEDTFDIEAFWEQAPPASEPVAADSHSTDDSHPASSSPVLSPSFSSSSSSHNENNHRSSQSPSPSEIPDSEPESSENESVDSNNRHLEWMDADEGLSDRDEEVERILAGVREPSHSISPGGIAGRRRLPTEDELAELASNLASDLASDLASEASVHTLEGGSVPRDTPQRDHSPLSDDDDEDESPGLLRGESIPRSMSPLIIPASRRNALLRPHRPAMPEMSEPDEIDDAPYVNRAAGGRRALSSRIRWFGGSRPERRVGPHTAAARAGRDAQVNAGINVDEDMSDILVGELPQENLRTAARQASSARQHGHRRRMLRLPRNADQLVQVEVTGRGRANAGAQLAEVIDLTADSDDGLLLPDNPRFEISAPRHRERERERDRDEQGDHQRDRQRQRNQNNLRRILNSPPVERGPLFRDHEAQMPRRRPAFGEPPTLTRSDFENPRLRLPRVNPVEIDLTSDSNQANMAEDDNRALGGRRVSRRERDRGRHQVVINLLSDEDDAARFERDGPPGPDAIHRAVNFLGGVNLGGMLGAFRHNHLNPRPEANAFVGGAPNPLGDNMPDLVYGAQAYDNPRPPHVPPPAAREGFTRDTGADDFVCPSCAKELAYDPDQADENGPPAKRARSRRDREEHFFWAVKECGHVYCKSCFEKRKDKLLPFVHENKKIRCAVENCEADVTAKAAWVGLFL